MNTKKSTIATALTISAFLILVTAACLLYLLLIPRNYGSCVAEIYQDGHLIKSIPLSQVPEPYIIEVHASRGGLNRIEVQPGKIGVIWADCPDHLCVSQGFADTPAIPIVCLPNELVIRLCPEDGTRTDPDAPDAITY